MAQTPGDSISTTQSAGAQSLDGWFRDTAQSNPSTPASPAPVGGGLNTWFEAPQQAAQQQRGAAPAFSPISAETLDQVATVEGLTPAQRRVMGALLEQESGSGRNAKTSIDGARGAAQVIPDTFRRYAKPGERIDDPASNLAVAARYIKDLGSKSGDDPARIAAGYFSGEGNINRGSGQAWRRDAADGNGKRVSSYVTDVLGRLTGSSPAAAAEQPAAAAPEPFAGAPKWSTVVAKPEYKALSADDKRAARDAYFQRFVAPSVGDQAAVYRKRFDENADKLEPDTGGNISDIGKSLKIGANIAAQDVRELVGRIPGVGDSLVRAGDAVDRYFSPGVKNSDELLKADSKAMRDTLTPEMRAASDKKWWDSDKGTFGDAWSDPRSYASGVLQSLPEQALTMLPAMKLAKFAYGAKLAAGGTQAAAAATAARTAGIAGALSEGSLGGAQSAREVRDQVLALPDATLEKSEAFNQLLADGMTPAEAKTTLAEDLSTRAFVTAGTVTGLFGGMGDRAIAKIFTEQVSKPLLKRVLAGAGKGVVGEGLLEELPQSAAQQLAQNEAVRRADPSKELTDDVLNQSLGGLVQGGLQGGVMGGGAAALNRGAPAADAAPADAPRVEPVVDEPAPAPAAPAATGAEPRSGGIADQDVLDYADSRYRQLVAARDGEVEAMDGGDGDVVEGVQAGAGLSEADAAELAMLQQNRDDARALAAQYGFDTAQPDSATVAAAANEAATSPMNDRAEPTQAQKEAGNYKKGSIELHGLDLAIENPQGSSRSGVSKDGRAWSRTLGDHYGYVRGTVGADGDGVDVFVGPHPQSTKVFVVDQIDPETGRFDEHKALLGYDSLEAAQQGYLANYEDGWQGIGNITEIPAPGFKAWLDEGDTTKPFGAGQYTPSSGEVPEARALVERQRSAMENYRRAAMSGDEQAAQAAGEELAAARAAIQTAQLNVADRAQAMIEQAAAAPAPAPAPSPAADPAPAPKPKTEKQAREQRAAKAERKPAQKTTIADATAKIARQDEEVRKAASGLAERAAAKASQPERSVATPAQTALIDRAVKSKIITPGTLRGERFRAGIIDATNGTAPQQDERSYKEGHAWATAKQSKAEPQKGPQNIPKPISAKPKTEKAAKAARSEKAPAAVEVYRGVAGKWSEGARAGTEWWTPSRSDAETYSKGKVGKDSGEVATAKIDPSKYLEIPEGKYNAETLNAAETRGDIDGVVVTRDGKPIIYASFGKPEASTAPKPKKTLADQRPAKDDLPDLNNIERQMTDADLADLGMGFTIDDGKLMRNGAQVGRAKVTVEAGPKEVPHVRVADIGVTSKGAGTGTMALAAIMGKAAQFSLPVGLTTESGLGKAHQQRLRAYYERMGFRKNTGDDKVKGVPEEYVWQPQVNDLDLTQGGPLARQSEPVRVNTLAKLKALEKKRAAGKLTDAEYQLAIQSLIGKLETRNDAQLDKRARDRERGELWLRERLLRAKRLGELTADQVDFALWALDKNPAIANDLGISLRDNKGDGVGGSYIPGSRVIVLAKGSSSEETVVHEIMHHTERMMPPAVQQGIVKEWSRALAKAWKAGTPEVRAALNDMMMSSAGDKASYERMMNAFRNGTLNYNDHYQLVNASEYWAVNASDILAKRADAAGSWVAQARQWLREMIQQLKNLLNLPSSAPVLAGLEQVMQGNGVRLSTSMLIELSNGRAGAVLDGIQEKNPSGTGPLNNINLRTAAQKAQAELVEEFGKPSFGSIDWWDKSIGTQYHKAAKNPLFKKVYDLAIKRENAVSLTAVRAAELAPGFLPRVDDFMGAMRTLAQGRKTGTQTDLAGKALLDGTLAGASVVDGKVWTTAELRAKGLNDQGIALYRQAREAIDASLDEVAAAEGYSTVHSFVPKSIREQVIDDPRGAQTVLSAALAKRIQLDELHLAAKQSSGASPAVVDAAKAKLMLSYEVRDTLGEIYERVNQLKAAGYTPLMRFGKYYVQVEEVDPQTGKTVMNPDTGKPNTLYFSRFETEAEASDAYFREQVANRGKDNMKVTSGPVNDEAFKMFSGISPETLELFADVVGAKEATEKFYQEALSERSALKRRITRNSTEGYSENMPRVLANFITSNGKFAAQRYYNRDINNAIRYIPRLQGDVQKEAMRLKEYVDNPGNAGAIASALSFTWFLGGNIASALINATQPVMMTLPYLSQFGASRAAAELSKAAPYAMGRKQIVDADLKAALKRGSQEGKVDAQEIFHLYSVGIQGVASILSGKLSKLPLVGSKVKGASESARARMNALGTLWGMPFAMVEGFNRRLTFIAAWNVAKATGNPDPYQFAVDAIDQTQGVYNKVNRPNWARGSVGRVVFTFAQFKIMNVEMIKRLATMGGPEGKKAAAMYLAVLILMAGLAGVPYADDVDDIIDTAGQWLGYNTNMKRTKREWAYKTLGQGFGDLALYGISSHLPIDVAGRMGLGNFFPATGILKPSGEGNRAQDIMELGGPAVSGLGRQVFDAYDAASMGNYGKAAMTLMPTAIKNVATGADMAATGKAKDMKGRIKTDVTPGEGFAKAIGLNPTVVAEKNRANMPINQDLALQRLVEASVVDQWARGVATGDNTDIEAAKARMENWNRKNPDTPVSISAQQIRAKAKTMLTPTDTRLLKGAPKEMRGRVLEGLKKED